MEFVTSKKVDITPRGAITNTNPPIRTPMKGVVKSVKDIRRCILAGAKVEEVMPGGGRLLLNITNYNIDNSNEKPTVSAPVGKSKPTNDTSAQNTEQSQKSEPEKSTEPEKKDESVVENKSEEKSSENDSKNDERNQPAESFKSDSENQPSQNNANRAAEQINTNYTRRQRRAAMHIEANKVAEASEEKVEMKDPEA